MTVVNKIVKQAISSFKNIDKSSAVNLEKLIPLVQSITCSDLGLLAKKVCSKYHPVSHAPVTHIDVYEHESFTLGVFIIRKGNSIPLHDHPGMIGICKVLFGSVRIDSYQTAVGSVAPLREGNGQYVTRLPSVFADCTSNCHILTPEDRNFHSVTAVGEDAAIFDLLAPPYSAARDCHYYKEFKDFAGQLSNGNHHAEKSRDNNKCWLIEIPQPLEFFCDTLRRGFFHMTETNILLHFLGTVNLLVITSFHL